MESQMRMRAVAGNLAVAVTAIALAGCHHYVKQEDYDAAISELRANDAAMRSDLDSLKSQIDSRFSAYNAKISQLQARVRLNIAAHFHYANCGLRHHDQSAPHDFETAN